MFKNLVRLYSMVVCLICSTILLVTISMSVSSVFRIVFAEYKYAHSLERYTNNEKFVAYYENRQSKHTQSHDASYWNINDHDNAKTLSRLIANTKDQLKIAEVRLAARREYVERIKQDNIVGIIDSLGWILVSIIFLVIHIYVYIKNDTNND